MFRNGLKLLLNQAYQRRAANIHRSFSYSFPSQIPKTNYGKSAFLALSVLGWLGFDQGDEDKESELIMTLKRAVLCQQRQEFDKAEQMLHLALRIAQQQQNYQGVLYCYDLMANVAFEKVELEKAHKLFVTVMQMLLASGYAEDDLKMIHISLKLARINHLLAEEEKALMGYNWCMEKIDSKKQNNADARMLYGVIQDWYAQYLLDRGQVLESLKHLKEAHQICCEMIGEHSEQNMLLLNDLGITSWRAGDMEKAENFLKEAIKTGNRLDDKTHVGAVHANLGLVYLQNGLHKEATRMCTQAYKIGKKFENQESIEQAKYCFDQIKTFMKQEK